MLRINKPADEISRKRAVNPRANGAKQHSLVVAARQERVRAGQECPVCHAGAGRIILDRKVRIGPVQSYRCLGCSATFDSNYARVTR